VFLVHIRENLECDGVKLVDIADTMKRFKIVIGVPDGLQGVMDMVEDRSVSEFYPELVRRVQQSGDNSGLPLHSHTVRVSRFFAAHSASAGMLWPPCGCSKQKQMLITSGSRALSSSLLFLQ
jgi:hypothetical protein